MEKKIFFNLPYINKDSKKNLIKVFKNKKFSDGEFQVKTEKLIEKQINSNHITVTQSCTDALEAAVILIGIKPGDEVIMPSYTFPSTANCVLLRGGMPVFIDVKKNDLNLDPDKVEKKITKKTKAIILVHYAGIACEMKEFLRIKRKYNLFLIEDAAHGYLAKYKGKYLGTIGDIGTFSFHESKNFVGGQGGAISINSKRLIKNCKIVFDKGTDRSYSKIGYYSWKGIGSEYRASELASSLIYSQLLKSQYIQKKRRLIWEFYNSKLYNLQNKNFYILKNEKYKKNSYHVFPIIFRTKILRDKFIKYMKKNKIDCFFHYYPLHMSSFGKKITKFDLEITEKAYKGLVRLPLYPDLKKKDLKKIIYKTLFFFKNYNLL